MEGMNVIGYLGASCGLSVAARNTVRLLVENGYPVAIADIPLVQARAARDQTFDSLRIPENQRLPHAINLFHLNPPVIGQLLKSRPPWLAGGDCMNIAVPFWELSVLPEFWISDLNLMDAVLCPSHFIEQTVGNAFSGPAPLIRHYPQTAFLPDNHQADRSRFGLPEKGVLFVMSFELASDIHRKNPWAVIQAFTAAFSPEDEAYLIVKINHTHEHTAMEKTLARLHEHAAANPRIILRIDSLTYEDVISLYESCDVYVSLHRSEGLGLGPMEAMLLGKAVIATAWSGTMDYMNDLNACLVGCTFDRMKSPLYRGLVDDRETTWAEPGVPEAAAWMRRLYENGELRRSIGGRARHSMLKRQKECRKGRTFEMLLAIFEQKKFTAAFREAHSATLQQDAAFETCRSIHDQTALFFAVTDLIQSNDVAAAVDLYDRMRNSFEETPELLKFDELVRQLRGKMVCS